MRKLFAVLAILATAAVASAQNPVQPVVYRNVTPVSNYVGATAQSPALLIKYFAPSGTAATSTTTVATAATSLTFVVNGAAYAGFEAPINGTFGGIIDMTDGAADSLGEVVDIINSTATTFSTGYFRAVIVNGLRSDVTSTLKFVADGADTDVTSPAGEVIYTDNAVLDDEDILFSTGSFGSSTSNLPNAYAKMAFNSKDVNAKGAFDGISSVVNYGYELFTGTTFTTWTIYGVTEYYGSGKGCVATATCGPNSGSYEVARVIFSTTAGASTVAVATPVNLQLLAKDEKVFSRVLSSGGNVSVWQYFLGGFQYRNE